MYLKNQIKFFFLQTLKGLQFFFKLKRKFMHPKHDLELKSLKNLQDFYEFPGNFGNFQEFSRHFKCFWQ
jgi:hypothetical protein